MLTANAKDRLNLRACDPMNFETRGLRATQYHPISDTATMSESTYNDEPIQLPEQDRFGFDPFAQALARAIRSYHKPRGTVVALNGVWGSGKSSALNLVRHHLAPDIKAGDLVVLDFHGWWFRGEEAVAMNFFRELSGALAPELGEKAKKLLPKLGMRLLKAGSAIGGMANILAPGVGEVVSGALDWVSGEVNQDDSIESLHAELTAELEKQSKKLLVVIDDIDRLTPEEALLIFRLVKSVGMLPNVIYLLVFDRELAERAVEQSYPSEGPHYLEKIVQASFELPDPLDSNLHDLLLHHISEICGDLDPERHVDFGNRFLDVVAPEIHTPRDVTRFANMLAVTWASVKGNVDIGDFVALEALRLHRPGLYRRLRQNKARLCGTGSGSSNRAQAEEWEKRLLGDIPADQREHYKKALMRLFPRLESVWSNVSYSGAAERWARERRVCDADNFDSYFRFSIGSDVIDHEALTAMLPRLGDAVYVETVVRDAMASKRSNGTGLPVLFSQWQVHASKIDKAHLPVLLGTLFALGDVIDLPIDKRIGFGNEIRLHWLIRALTAHMSLPERSALYLTACQKAALGWLAHFSGSAWADYHPHEGREPEREEDCLTTEADAEALRKLLTSRIVKASKTMELEQSPSLAYLLFRWADVNPKPVRAWTKSLISRTVGALRLAEVFTGTVTSHGMGDRVSRTSVRAQIEGLEKIVDTKIFRRRLAEIDDPAAKAFLESWAEQEARPGRF
jgi:predicted KAP-like P-loop ATPase